MSTPPPPSPSPSHTHTQTHPAPSLPTSPLSKRPKPSSTTTTPQPPTTDAVSAPTAPTAPPPQSPHILYVQKLSSKARTPTRGSAFAAGYDLYSAVETTIPARGRGLVETDIAIAVGEGCYGRIAPRSGLAVKHFIDTGAGVVDADYRGPVRVLLFNHGEEGFRVGVGDRVAQLVVERIWEPEVVVVERLEGSGRGVGGFGSTG